MLDISAQRWVRAEIARALQALGHNARVGKESGDLELLNATTGEWDAISTDGRAGYKAVVVDQAGATS